MTEPRQDRSSGEDESMQTWLHECMEDDQPLDVRGCAHVLEWAQSLIADRDSARSRVAELEDELGKEQRLVKAMLDADFEGLWQKAEAKRDALAAKIQAVRELPIVMLEQFTEYTDETHAYMTATVGSTVINAWHAALASTPGEDSTEETP
jgi:hypothetical protein